MHTQVIPGLIEGLRISEHNANVTVALAKIGVLAVPSLLEVLNDRSSLVRSGAVRALGMIGDASTLSSLLEVIKNNTEEDEIKKNAIASVGKIGNATAVPILIKVIKDASGQFDIQKIAISSLST